MATPAAILSILVEANTSKAAVALRQMQGQLEATGATITQVEAKSATASGALNKFGDTAKKHTSTFREMAKGVLEVTAAFEAFHLAKEAVDQTVELGHATERLTAITGLDTKAASTWIEAMKVRGVQARAVNMGFITLSRNIRNAETGSKTAKKAFDQLGISQRQLKQDTTQKAILQVADGLQKVKSPADRAALAQQLFGRGAQALIPVLAKGSSGVKELLNQTQKYGAFLPDHVGAIEKAADAQRQMQLAMDGLRLTIGTKLLPLLLPVVQAFLNFVAQMRQGVGAGGQVAKAIGDVIKTIKDAIQWLIQFSGGMKNFITVVELLAAGFVALKVAITAADLVGSISPWMVILAAVAAAAILIVKNWTPISAFFVNLWQQVRQATKPVVDWITTNVFPAMVAAFHALEAAGGALVTAFNAAFPVIKQVVTDAFRVAAWTVNNLLIPAFQAIKLYVVDILWPLFKVYFALISAAVSDAFKLIKLAWDNVLSPVLDFVKTAILNSVVPAFHALHDVVANVVLPVIHTLHDVFRDVFNFIWNNVVHPVMSFILGAFADLLDAIGSVANVSLPLLGKVFGHTGDAIKSAADHVRDLQRQLDGLPPDVKTKVDVNVTFASNVAGAISSITAAVTTGISNISNAPAGGSRTNLGNRATGGLIDQPLMMVGEEAPQHPEVVIATNPAYRQRNLGLFATAGKMLGIPGFATGGLASAASVVRQIDPWTATHAGAWIGQKAVSWAGQWFPGPGGGGALPHGGSGTNSQNQQLGRSMMLAAGWPPSQWPFLQALWNQESGWSASAVNASSGAYGIPQALGHGHPFNLGDAPAQIAWGLNYIRGRYGSPAAAEAHERAFNWYRRGGIIGYQHGGIASAGTQLLGAFKPPTLMGKTISQWWHPAAGAASPGSVIQQVTGEPGLPGIGAAGAGFGTAAGAAGVAGTISGARAHIAALEHQYSILSQYFSMNDQPLVNPDTGELNQPELNRQLANLDQLIGIRQQIFQAWGKVVAYTQRLVASYQEIIRRLRETLSGISTRGLRGNALTAAQQRQTDIRTAISTYTGRLTTAQGDLISAGDDRDSAWLALLQDQHTRTSIAGTKAQPIVAAGTTGGGGGADTGTAAAAAAPDISGLLQTLLTQAQQTLAVSQAQYAALKSFPPYAGSYAGGGIVPGPAGAARTIIAHGGERVGGTPEVHLHFAPGTDWLRDFVQVEIRQSGRSDSRLATRQLPGARR